jgi:hypothetical protein
MLTPYLEIPFPGLNTYHVRVFMVVSKNCLIGEGINKMIIHVITGNVMGYQEYGNNNIGQGSRYHVPGR